MENDESTENKPYWCRLGVKMEEEFIKIAESRYGLKAQFNPEKDESRYAVDLVVNGVLVDLKTVRTPLFTAGKYGYDPDYTVTLNVKDVERYMGRDMGILFWVEWPAQTGFGASVEAHSGLYGVAVARLRGVLGPIHSYQRRTDDRSGNATQSYLIDTRQLYRYAPLEGQKEG